MLVDKTLLVLHATWTTTAAAAAATTTSTLLLFPAIASAYCHEAYHEALYFAPPTKTACLSRRGYDRYDGGDCQCH